MMETYVEMETTYGNVDDSNIPDADADNHTENIHDESKGHKT
jgi:hypothetical protein